MATKQFCNFIKGRNSGRKANALLSECKERLIITLNEIKLWRMHAKHIGEEETIRIYRIGEDSEFLNWARDPLAVRQAFGKIFQGFQHSLNVESPNLTFAVLDPRPQGEAVNKAVFEGNSAVLGVEVTIPSLAEKCSFGNIDPQHTGGNAQRAAIEDALVGKYDHTFHEQKFGQRGADKTPGLEIRRNLHATVVTIRPDIDSVGAMAVISLRNEDALATLKNKGLQKRVAKIAEADTFARGEWPGPRSLPTRRNPWASGRAAGASDTRELAAIAAAVSDFKLPISERVNMAKEWLLTGKEPKTYQERVEKERMEMIEALENGIIQIEKYDDDLAIVTSTHRAGIMLGYSKAPVVVALNPKFRLGGGEPHRKFTVAQYTKGYVDLNLAAAELNKIEPGWGGSPTIIGSPQGVSSNLTVEKVTEIILHPRETAINNIRQEFQKHLLDGTLKTFASVESVKALRARTGWSIKTCKEFLYNGVNLPTHKESQRHTRDFTDTLLVRADESRRAKREIARLLGREPTMADGLRLNLLNVEAETAKKTQNLEKKR